MNAIGVIGFGALGKVLVEALHLKNLLAWIMIRDEQKHQFAQHYNVPIYSTLPEFSNNQDAIILAIPDKEILGIVENIHKAFPTGQSCTLIHCSGVLTKQVLFGEHPLLDAIAMHPFQSVKLAQDLDGIPWGIECESKHIDHIFELIYALNGIPYFLDEKAIEQKAKYHAMAVISANFLTILSALSQELADSAHIPSDLFLPKIQSTVLTRAHEALKQHESVISGLTGPLIRIDEQTIHANREAISSIPGMDEVYCAMCKAGIELLMKKKMLSKEQGDRLFAVLNEIPSH
jgi:predicted short-subunit dehydrogenase-like oxidoreductase (DUF2520 family)